MRERRWESTYIRLFRSESNLSTMEELGFDIDFGCLPYMMKGKYPGIAAPQYNKHFMGILAGKEYVCQTSGSDWEIPVSISDRHVDYHHDIVLLKKQGGFTVNGGPFRRFDDPINREFLDAIHYSEFPKELDPKVDDTKIHRFTIRRPEKHKVPPEDLPHTEIFEAGTPKEILDAAVAKTPNSTLLPFGSNSAGTRYMLYTYPPNCSGRNIQY